MGVFNQVRQFVMEIPQGRVATYGQIAKIIGTNPRVVGWALRNNPDASLPCHRVVKSDGTLADNFSLGNWPEQRRRLASEGVNFDGQKINNFNEVLYIPVNK